MIKISVVAGKKTGVKNGAGTGPVLPDRLHTGPAGLEIFKYRIFTGPAGLEILKYRHRHGFCAGIYKKKKKKNCLNYRNSKKNI